MLTWEHLALKTEVDLVFEQFLAAFYDMTTLLVPRPAPGAANPHLADLTIYMIQIRAAMRAIHAARRNQTIASNHDASHRLAKPYNLLMSVQWVWR